MCPRRNWICSSSPPEAWQSRALGLLFPNPNKVRFARSLRTAVARKAAGERRITQWKARPERFQVEKVPLCESMLSRLKEWKETRLQYRPSWLMR
jgi:hypothetical protein